MELVGVTAAARALDVDKATISRYVQKHPELNHQTEVKKPPLVNIDQLRGHRAHNVDPSKSGNHAGRPFGVDMAAPIVAVHDDAGDEKDAAREAVAASGNQYQKAKTAETAIKAKHAQLKLAEAMGLVVSRAVVEAAAFEVGQKVLQELSIRNRHLSEQIAVVDDPKEIAHILSVADREMLGRIADAFSRTFDPDSLAAE